MISSYFVVILGIAAELFSRSDGAATFPIPGDRPVATVDIPESGRPMIDEHGVDGVAPEGVVHLAVTFISSADPAAASAIAAARLAERRVVVAPATKRVGARHFNGFEAFKIDFVGVDPSGDCNITLILIAIPPVSGFVSLAYWGDDEAQESVSNAIQSIADSIEIAR